MYTYYIQNKFETRKPCIFTNYHVLRYKGNKSSKSCETSLVNLFSWFKSKVVGPCTGPMRGVGFSWYIGPGPGEPEGST